MTGAGDMEHSKLLGFLGSKNLSRFAGAVAGLLFLGTSTVSHAGLIRIDWTLSNGKLDGFWGSATASGTFTTQAPVNTASISVTEGSFSYTFTGAASGGSSWSQTSQIPPPACITFGCDPSIVISPGTAEFSIGLLPAHYKGTITIALVDSLRDFTGSADIVGVPVYSNSPGPRAGFGVPALVALVGVALWRRRDWISQFSR